MATRSRVVRSAIDPSDPETHLWPMTLLLLFPAGFIGTAIVRTGDFSSPHLLHNAWFRLGTLVLTVGLLLAAAASLRGRVLMRVQIAVLLSLLLHFLLVIGLREVNIAYGMNVPEPNAPALNEEELPLMPDHGLPFSEQTPAEQAHEKLLEVPVSETIPDPSRPQPIRPTEVKIRPREPLKSVETTQPQQTDLQRAEVSTPRRGEVAGQSLSKRTEPAPETAPAEQTAPAKAVAADRPEPPTPEPDAAAVAQAAPRRTAPPRAVPNPSETPPDPADPSPSRAERAGAPETAAASDPTPERRVQESPASAPDGGTPLPQKVAAQAAPQPSETTEPEAAAAPATARSMPIAARPQDAPDVPETSEAPATADPQRAFAATNSTPTVEPQPLPVPDRPAPNPVPDNQPARVAQTRPQPNPTEPSPEPADTPRERTAATALPTRATAAVEPSEAATPAPEAVRAERRSTPDTAETAAVQAPRPRSQGESLPTTSAEPARIAAVSPAESAAQPEPEAASPTEVRRSPGTDGPAFARNFTHEDPSVPVPSAQAGAAAARAQSSRTDAAAADPVPTKASADPRSVAGAEATAAALPIERAATADRTAQRNAAELEATSSAARRTSSSDAAVGQVQAAAGSAAVDIADNRPTAPATGLSRGAASQGAGNPQTAAVPTPPRRGRSAPAGEATEGAAAPAAAVTAVRGRDPSRIAGPELDSQAVTATRRNAPAGSPTRTAADSAAAAASATGVPGKSSDTGSAVARAERSTDSTASAAGSGPPTARRTASSGEVGPEAGPAVARASGGKANPTGAETGLEATTGTPARVARAAGGSIVRPDGTDPTKIPGASRDGPTQSTGPTRRETIAELEAGPIAGAATAGPSRNRSNDKEPGPETGPTAVAAVTKNGKSGTGKPATGAVEPEAAATAQRKTSRGPQIQVAADEGPGGLRDKPSDRIGLPERRARAESEQVSLQSARFLLEKSLGRPLTRGEAENVPPPTYVLRKPEAREKVAGKFGGTAESERAVEMGLDFLARQQMPDGRWVLHGWPDEPASDQAFVRATRKQSDAAATGLTLLAFLGAGYDHREGKYAKQVAAGLDWLIRHQRPTGDLYTGGNDSNNRFYTHGIAAIALCEASAMTRDPKLKEPVAKAIRFILQSQDPQWGGWRYRPAYEAAFQTDTSVTGWQVMALRSAEFSGVEIPPEAYSRVGRWLDYAQGPEKNPARYAYLPNPNSPEASWLTPSPAMTAEALLMRLYLGWNRQTPAMGQGTDYLLQHLPEWGVAPQSRDCYYWYYATQVMYHVQGDAWEVWNRRTRDLLVRHQEQEGALAGSWDPRGDKWSEFGGRIYVTTMHLLMLEVYYRHLPLYRVAEGQAAASKAP